MTIFDSYTEHFLLKPPRYDTLDWADAVSQLKRLWSEDIDQVLREQALIDIEQIVSLRIKDLPADAPFPRFHNGDLNLARLCYAIVRLSKPRVVVETGVCYGVTTSYILKALQENRNEGRLHSIDLPPLGGDAEDFVGWLVGKELRANWVLHRGASRAVLPQVLKQVSEVQVFVHDSLHSYRNIKRELATVRPFLSRNAVVVADDIEGNPAFMEWLSSSNPAYSAVLRERSKKSLAGVAYFSTENNADRAVEF